MKYKVGDKVRALMSFSGYGVKAGNVYTISLVNSLMGKYQLVGHRGTWSLEDPHWEPVQDSVPPKQIDWTKPVQTRDGDPVRILCTDGPEKWPVVGIVKGRVEHWRADGSFGGHFPAPEDLMNAPPPKEQRTVYMYKTRQGNIVVATTAPTFAKVVAKVTITEGDGLPKDGFLGSEHDDPY
jgi:hypothetical protein